MDFSFSDEQEQLRASIRAYLRDLYTADRRRAAVRSEQGWDANVWTDFSERLGILSLADPDTVPDPVDLMIVMEELGEALVIEPFLETVVAGAALLRASGGDRARHLLEGVVAGQVRLAVAWAEPQTPLFLDAALHHRQTDWWRMAPRWLKIGRRRCALGHAPDRQCGDVQRHVLVSRYAGRAGRHAAFLPNNRRAACSGCRAPIGSAWRRRVTRG